MALVKWLQGKKTYLCAAAISIIVFLEYIGIVLPAEIKNLILGLLSAGTAASLHAALRRPTA